MCRHHYLPLRQPPVPTLPWRAGLPPPPSPNAFVAAERQLVHGDLTCYRFPYTTVGLLALPILLRRATFTYARRWTAFTIGATPPTKALPPHYRIPAGLR